MEKHSERKPPLRRANANLSGLGLETCRTGLTLLANQNIYYQNGLPGLDYQGEFCPIVTRYTDNFNQRLCSMGHCKPNSGREILLLDPQSALLEKYRATLCETLAAQKPSPREVLGYVQEYVRQLMAPCDVTELVKQTLSPQNPFLPIDFFLQREKGSCRHYALITAYFLQALKEANILDGRIIAHRQYLKNSQAGDGAHAWVLFVLADQSQFYSIDLMFHRLIPGDDWESINKVYGAGTAVYLAKKHKPVRDCVLQQKTQCTLDTLKELSGLHKNSLYYRADCDEAMQTIDAMIESLQSRQVSMSIDEVKDFRAQVMVVLQTLPPRSLSAAYLDELADFIGEFIDIEPLEQGEYLHQPKFVPN